MKILYIILFLTTSMFSQHIYVGSVEVSNELLDVYNTVIFELESNGVDTSSKDTYLHGVYLTDHLETLSGNPNTIGYTLMSTGTLRIRDVIYLDTFAKDHPLNEMTLFHEITHFLLRDLNCNYKPLLFREKLNYDLVDLYVENREFYIKELCNFIKEKI